MSGMADVDCANCRHKISKHEKVNFGPTRCTVDGCTCIQGPAQRDDLVDVIMDQKEFLEELVQMKDLPDAAHASLVSFLASLDKRLEDLE